MITYWRVVSERHLRMTGVKDEHSTVQLSQLQTSATIQELLHACQHVSLQRCDTGRNLTRITALSHTNDRCQRADRDFSLSLRASRIH